MEEHTKENLAARSPNDDKALKLALHLRSGYHQMDESPAASASYLKKKHDEAHARRG